MNILYNIPMTEKFQWPRWESNPKPLSFRVSTQPLDHRGNWSVIDHSSKWFKCWLHTTAIYIIGETLSWTHPAPSSNLAIDLQHPTDTVIYIKPIIYNSSQNVCCVENKWIFFITFLWQKSFSAPSGSRTRRLSLKTRKKKKNSCYFWKI